MANDPYAELSLPRSATADEVRKAFRKLAKQYHPDANPGNNAAEERFKRISAAFDILGDPAKRARFDKGEIDAEGRETGGFSGGGGWVALGGAWRRLSSATEFGEDGSTHSIIKRSLL